MHGSMLGFLRFYLIYILLSVFIICQIIFPLTTMQPHMHQYYYHGKILKFTFAHAQHRSSNCQWYQSSSGDIAHITSMASMSVNGVEVKAYAVSSCGICQNDCKVASSCHYYSWKSSPPAAYGTLCPSDSGDLFQPHCMQ